MAQYKIPQDVEAEDKFIGFLTFKQFLFGGGFLVSGYIIFYLITHGLAFLSIIFFPFFIFCGFLAIPWSKDQPSELWLASRIRFILVPRKRIWDQSGVKDLVHITVPKREARIYTDGLNQDQVRNRLSALATVVDSRGWAIKNTASPQQQQQQQSPSQQPQAQHTPTVPIPTDRLLAGNQTVNESAAIVQSTPDVLDAQSSPLSQQFDAMIEQSVNKHRQATMALVADARPAAKSEQRGSQQRPGNKPDFSFLEQAQPPIDPNLVSMQANPVIGPGQQAAPVSIPLPQTQLDADDEADLLQKVHRQQSVDQLIKSTSHLKTINTLDQTDTRTEIGAHTQVQQPLPQAPISPQTSPSVAPVDPAILALAQNDDLSVDTIARQAKKDTLDDGEVVISLR